MSFSSRLKARTETNSPGCSRRSHQAFSTAAARVLRPLPGGPSIHQKSEGSRSFRVQL